MKAKSVVLCAAAILVFQLTALAQKTEVSVRKGKVVAETPTASVNIEAGRKAILSPDKNPTVTVNDPLVDDVMEIYKWVEAEKQAQRERIDGSGIQVYRIDDERSIKCAWLTEGTNSGNEPMEDIQRGPTLILKEPKYYDMEGNIIPFDMEKIDPHSGIYTLHLSKAIRPGEQIKYIGVSEIDNAVFSREGPLWIFRLNYGSSPNNLCYYRFILPESAIFVDSSRRATMIDSVDGRVAVTIRVYTGPGGAGVTIAYLWPDKDGTTIADIPPQYRGLQDQAEQEIVQAGQLEIAKISSGGTYEKQNTPLETLLSLFSAAAHKDSEQFLKLVSPNLREYVAGQMDQIMALAGRVVDYRFLGSPKWPDEPENGYAHPVYLCREGSLICEATLVMVYQDGKWYLQGIETGRKETESTVKAQSKAAGGVTISKRKPDLSTATYKNLKPGQFMRSWLFLGPIHVPWKGESYFPDEAASNKFFDTESLNLERFEPQVKVAGNDYEWTTLHSEYGVIDLTAVFDTWFVVAYAWAQVDMPEQTNAVLGIGSDDCIKVWLNGKLVHEHRGGRGAVADSDHVPVTFNKGNNQLVLKILNYGGPWGFACRLLQNN
jgi:hypothetical protein